MHNPDPGSDEKDLGGGWLRPGIAVMSRLRYPQKFLLVSALLLLPLAIVLVMFLQVMQDSIRFTQNERHGTEFLRVVRHFAQDLGEARLTAHRVSTGEVARHPDLVRATSAVDTDLMAILTIDARLGATLGTHASVRSLRENWEYLRQHMDTLPGDRVDALYADIARETNDFMVTIGNQSNLILDPDLDSYYLMDAIVSRLPDGAELLTEMTLAEHTDATGPADASDSRHALLAGLLRRNSDALVAAYATAFQNTRAPGLENALKDPVEMCRNARDAALAPSQDVPLAKRAAWDEPVDTEVARSEWDLWDGTVAQLDRVLTARIAREEHRKRLIAVVVVLALALAGTLLIAFYIVVMRTIADLERASARMLDGRFDGALTLHSRDEMTRVVRSFDDVAQRLRIEWEQAREETARATAAEEALRLSQERFRDALAMGQLGSFDWDLASGTWTWSEVMYRIHDWDPALGAPTREQYVELVPREDRGRFEHMIAAAIEQQTPQSYLQRVITPSGDVRHVRVTGACVRAGDGTPVRIAGIYQDITEEKLAEQALQASQERQGLLFSAIPDLVLVLDFAANVEDAKPSDQASLAAPREHWVGKPIGELFPRAAEAFADAIACVQAGQEAPMFEFEFATSDDTRYCEARVVAAGTDAFGLFVSMVLVRDITDRRQAEAELVRAKEQAEAANQAKSEFLATMSHEIRTPMNGVLGMLGLLLDTPLANEQRDFAETSRASAEALLAIINDILDFSKIEAGRLVIEPQPFELRQALEDVADLLASRADEKSLDLCVDVDPSVPDRWTGDPGRVRQILLNLVGNAIKFTERGHVRVSADLAEREGERALLRIAVEDTGIGIAEDKLPLLFTRFQQADSSMSRRFGGTGLGLAIAKQLATLMGGDIHVTSTTGAGSVFTVTLALPCEPDSVPLDDRERARVPVLLANPHTASRRAADRTLLAAGFPVRGLAAGHDVITALRQAQGLGTPHAVLVLDDAAASRDDADIEPLIRRIRSDETLAQPAIVALVRTSRRAQVPQLTAAGADVVLAKPVHLSGLANCIDRAHRARSGGRPVEAPAATTLVAAPLAVTAAPSWRVLLVDDNAVNQKVAQHLLKKLGCQVTSAHDGLEAVELYRHSAVDLVFMDCQMPGMDGYEATAAIRRIELALGRRTPIVAMTANAMEGDRERCLAAGMDDFIAKPIREARVLEALERWAGDGTAGRSAA